MNSEPHAFSGAKEIASFGLAGWVVRFAEFLKHRGFKVFQSSIQDALRSISEIRLTVKGDFFAVLRANLATSDLEWAQFRGLFNEFWSQIQEDREKADHEKGSHERLENKTDSDTQVLYDVHATQTADLTDNERKEFLEGVGYSPVSKIERKDLASFDCKDIQIAQLTLKKMMASFRVEVSRRSKRSRRHRDMDFPRIMRESLKGGGIPLELFYRQKKKKLKRLVVLADVSGSMDRYARFVMPFILGLRGVGSRAEVFVFSTSLTHVTNLIRHLSIQKTLERMAREVPEWSGGTRIGYSLRQFNEEHGNRILGRRTVVLILSDGWDLGGKELLRREMSKLSRKVYCVIWLNPLAGDPGYQPVCQGMRVALPYVDYFLPAHNLESLKRVGHVISRAIIH